MTVGGLIMDAKHYDIHFILVKKLQDSPEYSHFFLFDCSGCVFMTQQFLATFIQCFSFSHREYCSFAYSLQCSYPFAFSPYFIVTVDLFGLVIKLPGSMGAFWLQMKG